MAVITTQTDLDIIQSKSRNLHIKVDLLNFNFQVINSLEGRLVDGSIGIDANADIRRTCNITIVVDKSKYSLISPGGEIWLDKYIKVYVGLDNKKNNNEIVWWNMGIFLINSPNTNYNATTHSITFEGLDLMAKLSGKRNGQIPSVATLIPAGSKIADVVKSVITELAGFSNYIIIDKGYEIPYDIRMDMGSTIYDLLVKIRDLYADWEMFFDVEGVFYFQPIPSGLNEPIILDFDKLNQSMIINENVNVDFENVKNHIIVYGRLLDDGTQVKAELVDNNPESPFEPNKIGDIIYIINDEQIYSDELANYRANYELYLHSRMNDSITLDIVPIYWLNDVNVKIKYTNPRDGIEGQYLIKSLNVPLDIGSNMTINAIKLYEEI